MKRGFTLIELLGVVIILGIIALITFPVINDTFFNAGERLSENQKKAIENAAKLWGTSHTEKLSEVNAINAIYLTIDELRNVNLIENKDVIDPETDEVLNGCVKIEFKNNKYTYNYGVYESVQGCF